MVLGCKFVNWKDVVTTVLCCGGFVEMLTRYLTSLTDGFNHERLMVVVVFEREAS